jgi:predicted NBD/HSP70 family sugar kinase
MAAPGTPGRTARRYRLRGGAAHVAGLDVTSARIVARVCDLAGRVVGEATLPTPGRSASGAVDRVRQALGAACAPAGLGLAALHHAVIGIGGAIDPGTERLGFARHLPGWHDPDLLARLRTELTPAGVANPRVDVENDVNLAAVAEQAIGAAAAGGPDDPHPAARDFVVLWIAEGIGAAVVIDGRLHRGATGGAGEVGYMPVPGAPLVRSIGRGTTGGFQALAGGPAVLKLARLHGFTGAEPHIAVARAIEVVTPSATLGVPDSPAANATSAMREAARRLLAELADRLATGLAPIVAVLDPELIVLTGAVLRFGAAPLRDLIAEALHGMAIPRPRLVTSAVADNPVLAGAIQAALAATREAVFSSTGNTGTSNTPAANTGASPAFA